MKKLSIVFILLLCSLTWMRGQSVEELTQERDQKAAELAKLEGELTTIQGQVDGLKASVASLTDKITPYPRWTTGSLGTIGFNFANFSDWFSKDRPNTSAASIGLSLNAYANLDQKKSFWRNAGNLNLGWLKFDDKDIETDATGFQVSSDAFNITSLYGYKLSSKLAISTLGEYRTSILNGGFNDPGYLDLGVGMTWTPINNLVVVVHPLNYNFVFAKEGSMYESSLGAKVVADYTQQITKGVSWKSNLSAFLSYANSDFSNWTWVNSFSTAVKGVGVGLEVGLRNNKQEANAFGLEQNPVPLPENIPNPLQTYWVLGLSYALGG